MPSNNSWHHEVPALRRAAIFVLLVCAGALLVLTLVPQQYLQGRSTDYEGFYEPVAHNIESGRGLVFNGKPAVRYPPGYPLILAASFRAGRALGMEPETSALALAVLSWASSGIFIFLLSACAFSEPVGWIAGLIWFVYPPGLFLILTCGSETTFIPLFLLSALLLLRAESRFLWLSASGLVLGAAILCRSVAVGLPVVWAGFAFYSAAGTVGKRSIRSAVVLVASLLCLLPWVSWSGRKAGA